MSYSVEKMNVIGQREVIGSVLLNESQGFEKDGVKTTLSIQALVAERNKSLRRGSTLSPPSENWYGWMSLFQLRRMSTMDVPPGAPVPGLDVDDIDGGEVAVYCEQILPNKTSVVYKLFSSTNQEESALACESLKRTLQYFAGMQIPVELLKLLVLPQPKTLTALPRIVLEYLHDGKEGFSSLVDLQINNFPLAYHACVNDEVEPLKILIDHGADIMSFEEHSTGNGLLHIAAKYSHSCLVLLLDYMKSLLSNDQFQECINKVNHYSLDSKRLKNPAMKIQTISLALAGMNVLGLAPHRISPEPKRKNHSGVTPLMIATGESNIKSVGVLLTAGADPNIEDPSLGTTALHIAASIASVPLIQLLLSFGASIENKNDDEDTPLDLAKKSQEPSSGESVQILKDIRLLREQSNQALENSKPQQSTKKGKILLCIDGGGTRALIPAFILKCIEDRMRHISNKPEIKISQYFSWMSGTSAGSSLIYGMIYNSASPSRFLTSIIAERDNLFSGNRIYKEEGLEKFIRSIVGKERFVDEVKEPKMIVPTTLSDRNPPECVLVTNYQNDLSGRRWKVHEAIQASSAAPTYFPAFEKKYVDGGLMIPNPTLITVTEALKYSDNEPITAVLSLGTGKAPTTKVNLIDLVYPRMSSLISDIRHDLMYVHQLVDLLTANMSNMEHSVAYADSWCRSIGAKYYRLTPELTSMHALDSKDDAALTDLFYETYVYCLKSAQQLETVAVALLNNGPQHSS